MAKLPSIGIDIKLNKLRGITIQWWIILAKAMGSINKTTSFNINIWNLL